MAKKIFDIIPPHLVSDIKELVGVKKTKKKGKRTHSRFRGVVIFCGIFVLLLAIFLYFKLASLSVVIWPATKDVSFDEKITAAISSTGGSLEIPAQFIEEEKELWQEFDATGSGSDAGIAKGTIKVYNKYSPAKTITLVAGTHFLSDSGKYFKSVAKISIPAAQVKNGKTVPGSVNAEVVAVEAGEEYNIDPSQFSVPKLVGTPYYYSVYAESTKKMSGGYESTTKVVTAEDITNAKDSLVEKLSTDLKQIMIDKASSDGLVLFEDALSKEITESSSSVKAGAEVDKFNYKMKIKMRALVFKEDDLKVLAKNYILFNIDASREFLDKSLALEYYSVMVNTDDEKISFDLKMLGKTYPLADKDELVLSLRQKTSEEIREAVYSAFSQEISQVKINLWPFWVRKAPKNIEKIRIDFNFE